MKFIAISDTHDNLFAVRDLLEELKGESFEFVVHAGDVIAPFTLRELSKIGSKFYIAYGNNDGDKNLLAKVSSEYGWVVGEIVEFPYGVVYHGSDERVKAILRKLTELGKIIVFGHTHEPLIDKSSRDGFGFVLNPGEVCGYLTGRRTYAIIEDWEVSIQEF